MRSCPEKDLLISLITVPVPLLFVCFVERGVDDGPVQERIRNAGGH